MFRHYGKSLRLGLDTPASTGLNRDISKTTSEGTTIMAFHGLPMTGSGVTDCAQGCGEHVMTSDLSKPAFCGDGECIDEDEDSVPCAECGCSNNEFDPDCVCRALTCPANCFNPYDERD
jgi:hypothetical protein